MSRLAPAIRHRRRLVDALARTVADTARALADREVEVAALTNRRADERRAAPDCPVAADAWFTASRRRLGQIASEKHALAERLAGERAAVRAQAARLQRLEEIDAAARRAQRLLAERRAEAEIADLVAARSRRR